MDKKNSKWLCVSIFVSKSNWHLLMNVLKPFIQLLFDNNELLAFKLAFDYQCSENIRLALLVPSNKVYVIAELTDEYLKDFFKTKQLLPTLNDNQDKGIFMPYFNNTVQYGLYSSFVDRKYKSLQALERSFSILMIEAFADVLVDDEMIITFALYILFDCYKLIQRVDSAAANKWISYYQHVTTALTATVTNRKLIDNQHDLLESNACEIYTDTVNDNGLDDMPWIRTWEDVFSTTWTNVKSKYCPLLFAQINNMINQQLALDPNAQMLISIIVNKTIEKVENYASI